MKSRNLILACTLACAVAIASTSATAATFTVTETGSLGTNDPVTDTWGISVAGPGTLEITLVQADESEWFEWSLSGAQSGGAAFYPAPWTGAVNQLLGSWYNTDPVGLFSFTSTNYPSVGFGGAAVDYTVEFAFTPALTGSGPAPYPYITVTPTAVPLPAAAWLFGAGLLGVVGLARRKKAS